MNDVIKLEYPKSEYWNILLIIGRYIVDWTKINVGSDVVACEFKCRKWSTKRCLRELDIARKLGHENKVVVI